MLSPLARSIGSALEALLGGYPSDHFYYVEVEAMGRGFVVGASSREGLDAELGRRRRAHPGKSDAQILSELRETGGEYMSSRPHYLGPLVRHFGCSAESVVAALRELDYAECFGPRGTRRILLGVNTGSSMSRRKWYDFAAQLNPSSLLESLDDRLPFHPPSSNAEMFGPPTVFTDVCCGGGRVAAFHESGMQLWDFDRRELIRRVDGYDVWKGHMSSGGGVVAFNLAGGLSILDASSGAIQSPFTYPTGFRGRAVGLSPSGGVAAVGGESAVWIIDLRTGNAIGLDFGGLCVAFSPDGTKLIACDRTGNVRMVEVQTGVSLAHHTVDSPIAGCAWLPSGDRVALVTSAPAWNPKRGRVLVLSAPALRPVITLRDEWANGQAMAVSRDGKLIAVTSGRWLVVMDDRGVEVSRARGSQSRLYSVGFAADDYAVGVGYDEDSLAGIVAHKIPGG